MEEAWSLYLYVQDICKILNDEYPNTNCGWILANNLVSNWAITGGDVISKDNLELQMYNINKKKACETYTITDEIVKKLFSLKIPKVKTAPKYEFRDGSLYCEDIKLFTLPYYVVDMLIKKGWTLKQAVTCAIKYTCTGGLMNLRLEDRFYNLLFDMGFTYETFSSPFKSVFYLNNLNLLPLFEENNLMDTLVNTSFLGKMVYIPLITMTSVVKYLREKAKNTLIEAEQKKIPTTIITFAFAEYYDNSSEHLTTLPLSHENYVSYNFYRPGVVKPFADLTLMCFNYGNVINLDKIIKSLETKKKGAIITEDISWDYSLYLRTKDVFKMMVYNTWALSDKAYSIYREYLANLSIRNPYLFGEEFDNVFYNEVIRHLKSNNYVVPDDTVNYIRELIVTFEPLIFENKIYITNDTIVIDDEQITIGNIKGDTIKIASCVLHYKTHGEDFYNVPNQVFAFYKSIIRVEGNATPFNNHASQHPQIEWCSTYEGDLEFGSSGHFHANKPSFVFQKIITKSFINLIANSQFHIVVCTYYNNLSTKLKELLKLKNKVNQKIYSSAYITFNKERKYSSMVIAHFHNQGVMNGKADKYLFPEWA